MRRELEAAFAGEQDHTPRRRALLCREQRSERRSACPADTAPEHLRDKRRTLGQRRPDHAERRRSRLGDHNVSLAEELAHHRPERRLRDHLVLRAVRNLDLQAEVGGRLRHVALALELLRESGQQLMERDFWVCRVLDEGVVRVAAGS